MKVVQVNYSDIVGGAARAAYRIHHALYRQGIDSHMWVNLATSGDWSVKCPISKWSKAISKVRAPLGELMKYSLHTDSPAPHSPAILPSGWPARLNASDDDVVHLHWVNSEMMSVADISRIRKPVVWTLHDMWAFCGAEHHTEDLRWREGYTRHNRPAHESGFDLNRWVWRRKSRNWHRPMHIVTPSRWLADCARKSALMRDWSVQVVHNAIDTDLWQPVDKSIARQLLHLPPDVPLLLFGAIGGGNNSNKGFDLLRAALQHLRGEVDGLELVVFGQLAPRTSKDLGFPIHYTGHLHDDVTLRLIYSAVDAMMIPSRKDNLPNTGIESLTCGTPVVAFDTSGLPDIVTHQQTGYLARPFDVEDLARGILWVLADHERYTRLSANAREHAVSRFSYPVVAAQYKKIYEEVVAEFSNV